MRLMDKNDFLDLFYVASAGQDKRFIEAVEMVVEDTPIIDAVPVVRCRECKHWTCFMNNPDGTLFGNCECYSNDFRNEGDFCSYGERKDGEG